MTDYGLSKILFLWFSIIAAGVQAAWAQPVPEDPPLDPPSDAARPDDVSPTDTTATTPSVDVGRISGTVRSPDLGAPLSGVSVSIEGTNVTATTDEFGRFELSAPPGRVTLRVEVGGFRADQIQVTTSAGKTTVVDLSMPLDQLLTIDDRASFYSFGDIGHRNAQAAGFYRFPSQTTQNVPQFYSLGFLPEIHSNINDLGVTIGVRHKGKWTIDASITHGRNSFQFNVENSVNASYGTLSPTSFDAGTLSAQETVGNLDVQRKIETGALKSLALVLGLEARNENYQINAGDQKSWDYGGVPSSDGKVTVPGAQVFPGFQPANEVDRGRTNVGAYAGFESEIVKGLNIDLGGRYERSTDFGNTVMGKIAARVPIGKPIALRGAASTGFRVPSLQQLWFNNISTVFILDPATNMLAPNQVLTSNNASPITKAFGIPQLKSERSINLSGGIALRPLENLSLTADVYFIRIKDRIALTATFPTTNSVVRELLAPFQGVTQAQFFANAIDTDTHGLDVVAEYAVEPAPARSP